MQKGIVTIRGFLIHLTHYDPVWCRYKSRERPFDLDMALEIIDTLAEMEFNLLIIDCADGVKYRLHPELSRNYTVPASCLRKLSKYARQRYIDVVPKLNFSKSRYHRHNDWFRPYSYLPDSDKYWRIAFEIIDELISVCQPRRYFHIGMDEDHERSHTQYIEAILRLRQGLKQRGLRTIIWNDSSHGGRALIHARKSIAAERVIYKDIIHIVWNYKSVRPDIIHRLVNEGFQVWVAPGADIKQVIRWKQAMLKYGSNGLIMTTWQPCRRSNRARMLKLIRTVGSVYK